MKQDLEATYLGIYLVDRFFLANTNLYTSLSKSDIFSAACLMLGGKMREVNTKTPYASEVKRFEDIDFEVGDLKKAEIIVSKAFDWEFHFFTFYDYLLHFLFLGALFSSDIIMVSNSISTKGITELVNEETTGTNSRNNRNSTNPSPQVHDQENINFDNAFDIDKTNLRYEDEEQDFRDENEEFKETRSELRDESSLNLANLIDDKVQLNPINRNFLNTTNFCVFFSLKNNWKNKINR